MCDACGGKIEADKAVHVTLEVRLQSVGGLKVKTVHFWLCPKCEGNNRVALTAAPGRERRLARALAPEPWYLASPSGKEVQRQGVG